MNKGDFVEISTSDNMTAGGYIVSFDSDRIVLRGMSNIEFSIRIEFINKIEVLRRTPKGWMD